VTVPEEPELVATGAALQAAAMVQGSGVDVLAEAWGPGTGRVTEPDRSTDRRAVLEAYAAAASAAGG
jgi:hypothetical protein